jgi:hypothetical protein
MNLISLNDVSAWPLDIRQNKTAVMVSNFLIYE